MTASEFAFLALGLILGVASGAALLEVLRSRPPAPREIRLTVTPDSVPRRAATLAVTSQVDGGPARGGPADRRGEDRPEADGASVGVPVFGAPAGTLSATTPATARTSVPSPFSPIDPSPADPSPMATAAVATAMATTVARPLVGIAIEPESDSILPPVGAVPVAASVATPGATAVATPVAAAVAASVAVSASGGSSLEDDGSLRREDASKVPGAGGGPPQSGSSGPSAQGSTGSGSTGSGSTGSGSTVPGAMPPALDAATDASTDASTDPCAAERRLAEERCAVAERLAAQAEAAAAQLRDAQRSYDDHQTRAARAADEADPRALRAAKDAAQAAFRAASATAGSQAEIEAAASAWLSEINRTNQIAREATATLRREQDATNALVTAIERLSVEADAARITAESAQEACLHAREAVAACEEAATRGADSPPPPLATAPPAGPDADGASLAGTTEPDDSAHLMVAASAAGEPVIFRLLRADRAALALVVGHLAGEDPAERRRWQLQVTELVDAILARAIEASYLDFPIEHSFWGGFSREQSREIMTALTSLGYHFDGLGGFSDGRVPSQRDLSLAVGFAGLDPMRIRRWPNEAETTDLLRNVDVAADEYIATTAGGMTLGEMVAMLGRRADGLTDLWNAWGRVRPLLMSVG